MGEMIEKIRRKKAGKQVCISILMNDCDGIENHD